LHGVLFDLPTVVAGTTSLRNGAVAERRNISAETFFKQFPRERTRLMRVVVHDWNDEDALKILKNCPRAIPANGKLLLIESVLKNSNQPDLGKFNDLIMLVMAPGGRERTEAEFTELLRKAAASAAWIN
jgi:hypothetical protein